MKRLPSHAGLSLIELLIGLALTAMLLVATTSMLQVSSAAASVSAAQLDLQEQAQFAARRIAQRIEQTPAAMLAPKANNATSGTWLTATYDLRSGSTAGTLALSETIGATTRVLAEPATSLSITSEPVAAGRTVVTVAFTLANGNASAGASFSARLGGAP